MNFFKTIVLFVTAAILMAACSQADKKEKMQTATKDLLVVSTEYKPPVFTDDQRIQKIEAVLPEIDTLFSAFAKQNHIPGYVFGVVVGDSLLYSKAVGALNLTNGQTVDNDSEFHIASMTKSFTAMAIVKLRDEGKLSLLDPVSDYIPELQLNYLTRDSAPITIENLLTMTSGMPEDNTWADRQLDDTNEEFLNLLSSGITFSHTPSHYEYSNLGFAMLGTIITRVAEEPFQQYITKEILTPLGMKHTYWEYDEVPKTNLAQGYRWEEDKFKKEPILHTGAFGAIGGLITSMNDFSKYVAYHLSAYPARSTPETGPVKRNSLREMHRFTAPRLYPTATDGNGDLCPSMRGYGYGLGIKKDCKGCLSVGHSGGLPGYGSNYIFYPEYGIGIIAFCNRTYAPAYKVTTQAIMTLITNGEIKPREVSTSDILKMRTPQVAELIKTWGDSLSQQILAENFYLDKSRDLRKKEAQDMLAMAGEIVSFDTLEPINQLRGTFVLRGEKTDIKVFFSLSPEKIPKVQSLNFWIIER